MVKSMTGYGRAQCDTPEAYITVDMKSVNHRYFELSVRLPRQFNFLEDKVKNYLKDRVSRGKIECNIYIETLGLDNVKVAVNHSLAKAYYDALKEVSDTYDVPNTLSASQLAHYNDVLSIHKEEADEDALWAILLPVLEEATANFIAMREKEGIKMKEDICGRADTILEYVAFIEQRSPETVKEYNEKMKTRISELLGDAKVDEQRLLTEAAVYADKVAVDEETVRLHSHIEQLKEMFNEEEPIGRKMDFLVQEINRETNTIGSKASDLEITSRVLNIKGEVEKIREQIQNIE